MEKKKSTGSDFKIEKKIPVPGVTPRKTSLKYPWPDMKPGDSFYIEGMKHWAMMSCAEGWAARNDMKWKFRAAPEETGCRIWRIE